GRLARAARAHRGSPARSDFGVPQSPRRRTAGVPGERYCSAKTTWTVAVTVEVPGLLGGGAAVHLGLARLTTGAPVAVGAEVAQPETGAALVSSCGVSSGPSPSSIARTGPRLAPARAARAVALVLALSKAAVRALVNAASVSPTKKLGPLTPVAPAAIATPTS